MRAAAAAVLVAACTGSNPPTSRAQIIGRLEDTIGGPHAIGRVGDYLLENDQIRLIVAGTGVGQPGQPDVYGRVNTTFGGTLVDADLQRVGGQAAGNDELAELLPGFVFSVIDPTQVCVPTIAGVCPCDASTGSACPPGSDQPLVDGSDGNAAEIMVTGHTGDLFEMIALLNTGLVGPQGSLDFTQVYKLVPGKKYVTIETTIHNPSTGAFPLPYLDPASLDAATGMNIPGIANLTLSSPMGQLPLFGGEQDLFAPGVAGFNVRFAIQDSYGEAGGFPGFPGLAVDYLATRGPGVSYGLAMPMAPDNYVNSFPASYPGQTLTPYSMLLPFTYAGVTAAYMYEPPAQLQADEQRTYTSYFVIGRGDVASVYDTILDLRGTPTGTLGGLVLDSLTSAPVAGANIIVRDAAGNYVDQLGSDAGGAFLGHLPAGTYTFVAVTDDRPITAPQTFTITAGAQTGVGPVLMAPPTTLAVQVLDELGRHAPAKFELLAHDTRIEGVDGRNILYSLALGEAVRPTALDGTDRYVENAWWTNDGRLEATVRPGDYDLVVSRGPEYEVTTVHLGVTKPGGFVERQLALQRSFSTDGWIAGDFHVHSQPSTDSGLPIVQRVTSCAAEGLEVAVATDHNYITDYTPVIAASGLDPWLLGISGMELTTFEMGHFIGYPLKVDPGSTRGGEFVWLHQPPQSLFDQLRKLAIDPSEAVVTVAHPRQQVLGYFAQFFVDQDTAAPYTPTGILGVFAPYGDEFQAGEFSYDFDAMELLTGRRNEDIHVFAQNGQPVLGSDGKPTFPGTVETWFALLDHGRMPTGMGASDSHHLLGDEPGYARTMLFVGAGKDVPGGFTRQDVIGAIKAHHAIVTNAPFVTMTIGNAMIGDTVVASGAIAVHVHVSAPSWAAVNTLTLYGSTSATPDHVVQSVAIPAPGTSFDMTFTINPTQDAWVAAEVTGTSNMFPVLPPTEFPPLDVSVIIQSLSVGIPGIANLPIGTLKPNHIHTSQPYAMTNPIWIDIDGNGWTPPKSPLVVKASAAHRAPDVRARFDALPEVTP